MKIFIINLIEDIAKKHDMLSQLQQLDIKNYDFIQAVNGKALTVKEVHEKVYDYPKCQLTSGEIGCALSHYQIYKKMVDENISHAIVLEDDILLPKGFNKLIKSLKKTMDTERAKILTLGKVEKFFRLNDHDVGVLANEYSVISSYGTYAYCINLAAAKNLVKHLLPIKYEADMFRYFRENGWIDSFNVIYPQAVEIVSNHDDISNIHAERYPLIQARKKYRVKQILNKRPLWIRFKARLQRIFWKFKQIKVDR